MKHWINRNYRTLIISAFLMPIITVAIVSISHVTQWYGISNPLSWAIYLSFGIEIAAMSALAAISAKMGKNVYFPFIVVTIIQFIGNIFFAYEYIDITSAMFKSWVELVSPIVSFIGVEPTDLIGHRRFLAFFAGGLLPVISLSFLHMLVKFTEEDRMKDVKEEYIHQKEIEEKIKHDVEETVNVDDEQLKNLVEESIRVKLSEKDLDNLETVLNKTSVSKKRPEQTLDEINEYLDEEIDSLSPQQFVSPGIFVREVDNAQNHPMMNEIVGNIEETKEEIEENDRVKLNVEDLEKLENVISRFEPNPNDEMPLDDVVEQETYIFEEPEEYDPEDLELWDNTLMDGLEDNPYEEPYEFDGDPIDDYYPLKFEEDYYLGNNGNEVDISTLPEEEKKEEQAVELEKKKFI